MTVLYDNDAFSILVLSAKKWYSFMKKVSFPEICFKVIEESSEQRISETTESKKIEIKTEKKTSKRIKLTIIHSLFSSDNIMTDYEHKKITLLKE